AIGPGSSVGRRSLLTVTPDPAGADSRIDIGRHTYIGRGCTLSACGSVRIGDEVTFGDNVYLSAGQHGFAEPGTRVLEQPMMAGQVAVGNGAWIGFGAFISSTARLEIGAGAIVMANAVVTRSVPPLTMVGGVPAIPIKRFDSERREWVRVTGPEQRS
ncbi:MAG: acyltransferase, partial [Novosphingobium sp.]|nr:acyltransferase [Novosphingobium sp.]